MAREHRRPGSPAVVIRWRSRIGAGGDYRTARDGCSIGRVGPEVNASPTHITGTAIDFEGLGNAPRAFLGLFRGENVGKMLVKIGPDPKPAETGAN
jgi:hypothetical protein